MEIYTTDGVIQKLNTYRKEIMYLDRSKLHLHLSDTEELVLTGSASLPTHLIYLLLAIYRGFEVGVSISGIESRYLRIKEEGGGWIVIEYGSLIDGEDKEIREIGRISGEEWKLEDGESVCNPRGSWYKENGELGFKAE